MSIQTLKGVWWKKVDPSEKLWLGIALLWCLILFAMMPFWHLRGGQNPSGVRAKVDPAAFAARVDKFIKDYQVAEDNGVPVVAPPAGSDIYMLARMWRWTPVLRLKQGVSYTLHLSSADINHGFNLYPVNLNFQIVPGYDYGLRIVPNKSGDFRIVCNEFCGIGHHMMVGKVVVD